MAAELQRISITLDKIMINKEKEYSKMRKFVKKLSALGIIFMLILLVACSSDDDDSSDRREKSDNKIITQAETNDDAKDSKAGSEEDGKYNDKQDPETYLSDEDLASILYEIMCSYVEVMTV